MATDDRGGCNNSEWAHREALARQNAQKEGNRVFIIKDRKDQVVVSHTVNPGERVLGGFEADGRKIKQ